MDQDENVNDGANPESWPDFELPTDVPRDDAAAAGQPNAEQPNPAPAGQPDAMGGAPQGQPPAPAGGAVDQNGDLIPKYRLDEVAAVRDSLRSQLDAQTQQIATLTSLVQKLTGAAPGAENQPPAAPTISPQDQQIRDRLLAVFPELKDLMELKDLAGQKEQLLGVLNDAGRWKQAEASVVDTFVEKSVESIFDKVAAFTLGDGKSAKDLNPMVQQSVVGTFSRWVASDPARAARYERLDPALADEFWTAYKAAVYDPVKRDTNAALLQRAGQRPAIPQGGQQTPPAPPAPKPPASGDEDAIHSAAWGMRGDVASR